MFRQVCKRFVPYVVATVLGVGRGNCIAQVAVSSSAAGGVDSSLPDAPGSVPAGDSRSSSSELNATGDSDLRGLPHRFLHDELAVVTSPTHLRKSDLVWFAPLAGAGAAAIATDTYTMRNVVSRDPSLNSAAGTSSDVLRGLFIGAPVALYGGGLLMKNEHAREAGMLGGEAMIDAYVAGLAIKYITLRERPAQHSAGGAFFSGDAVSDPSFVSGHSVVVWSSAAVLAAEYNKPWQQVAIYTLATGGSLTRVLAQQHFPADALLGSATGWLIGHYVYRAHHRLLKR